MLAELPVKSGLRSYGGLQVKAVAPYSHPGDLNFKLSPYEAWVKGGGLTAAAHYPPRLFHGLAFRWSLPPLWHDHREARLRFVEPVSVTFDTFPDTARYEVIPMVWDCWPRYFEKMCTWMERHRVRTAIFTSSLTAERMRQRFPEMNVMFCPEAVDTAAYAEGSPLADRTIGVLEFGRGSGLDLGTSLATEADPQGRRGYVSTMVGGKRLFTNEQLRQTMGNAQVTIALPRSMTQPEVAGDVETLTQRYWENMLSRMVMVGHAPRELVDLVGYNPVLEIDRDHAKEQIAAILAHIADYQPLVDRNRETALAMGSWELRIRQVAEWLRRLGYVMV